jgi:hypothetical protein
LPVATPHKNWFQFSLLCEQHTNLVTPSDTKLIDALKKYFAPAGPLNECTFDQLHQFATIVYDRYMCATATDDASGHAAQRDVEMYGEPWSGEVVNNDNEPDALPIESITCAIWLLIDWNFSCCPSSEKEEKAIQDHGGCTARAQFF